MGLIELIIVLLVVLWLLGYLGRGRFYARDATATDGGGAGIVHLLLLIAVVLVVLRLFAVI